MFKIYFSDKKNFPDNTLAICYILYITLVIASILLFNEIIEFNLFGMYINIAGSIVPYVLLYPISFIVLRVYGYKTVNQMIVCMLIASLFFTLICFAITSLPINVSGNDGLRKILHSAFQMYIAGFIAVPLGLYMSFLAISILDKIGLTFGIITLIIATFMGELVNSAIIFPLGFHNIYSLHDIFTKIIMGALIFKLFAGIILAITAIWVINILTKEASI